MFVFSNALSTVASLFDLVVRLYVFILIGSVICSWVNADPFNPIVRFIRRLSDPFLNVIRRFVPPIAGLDFSPLIGILILEFGVRGFLIGTLMDLARRLR
jgi:YggT family protein